MNYTTSLILKVKDATSAVANVDDYNGSAQLLAATTLRFLAMLVALAPNLVSLLVITLRCFGMAGMFLQCGYLRKLIVPFFQECAGDKKLGRHPFRSRVHCSRDAGLLFQLSF